MAAGGHGAGGTHSCWGAPPDLRCAVEEEGGEGEEAVEVEAMVEKAVGQAEVTTEAAKISVEGGSVEKVSGEAVVGGG